MPDITVPEFAKDMNIIQALGDTPGVDDDLSPQDLKAKFDEAGIAIKEYLNTQIVSILNSYVVPSGDGFLKTIGGTMLGPIDMNNQALKHIISPTEDTDPATKKYVDDENARFFESGKSYCNNAILSYANVKVQPSAWEEDSTNEEYPWKGTISIEKIKANMAPSVILSQEDSLSGNFSPKAITNDGSLNIWAAEKPESELTIPNIVLWRIIT